MSKSPAKDLPLRDDIQLLGNLLGEVLKEIEGKAFFQKIEKIRSRSKNLRSDKGVQANGLKTLLKGTPHRQYPKIVQAFGFFLQLANMAEQHHRNRRRLDYLRSKKFEPQNLSIEHTFQKLKKERMPKNKVKEALSNLDINLVLTAHPTEIRSAETIQNFKEIVSFLKKLDREDLNEWEREKSIQSLKGIIKRAWLTDQTTRSKPSPLEEAKSALAHLEQVVWHSLPKFQQHLSLLYRKEFGEDLPLESCPIRFSSWMGGDRDGNPNVTHLVTREILAYQRYSAADLYMQELKLLYSELALNSANQKIKRMAKNQAQPYRIILKGLIEKFGHTKAYFDPRNPDASEHISFVPKNVDEILEPLKAMYESLISIGAKEVAEGRLKDLVCRLNSFGLGLAKLDLRQDASEHLKVMDAYTRFLGEPLFSQREEKDKILFLKKERQRKKKINFEDFIQDGMELEIIRTLELVNELGAECFGTYVISHTCSASDMLVVQFFMDNLGMSQRLPVAPLLESIEDLKNAPLILQSYLAFPGMRKKLAGKMEVMIGYSDSSKDGGKVAASWNLFKAQEDLVKLFKKEKIHLTLFHGRGGTVGRGGGPTYLAIGSQPPGSIQGSLKVTVQGEMIHSKFGLEGIAERNLDVYFSATLMQTLVKPKPVPKIYREVMEFLADKSEEFYRSIVWKHPEFVSYFQQVTPIREMEHLKIGSRPSKRKKQGGVESLRAIPWVFSWTQNRLILPSWLGLGQGLYQTKKKFGWDILQEMDEEWGFFANTMDLLEMVLAKSEMNIFAHYEQELSSQGLDSVSDLIFKDYGHSVRGILRITDHSSLLNHYSVLKRSINVRNPYVDPIHIIQVEVLKKLRSSPKNADLIKTLLLTFSGIAAGMRNTG